VLRPQSRSGAFRFRRIWSGTGRSKKPVTLRLDADVIAWCKESGRGYQTRINRALRKMMKDEIKEEKKESGE